jgi:hypothetical protein
MKFPPRIHCILAPKARNGVVIRRGPSHTSCLIRWQLDRDEFQIGQWMRARIFARRSDLSPDGQHFIYFALNGRWHTESKGSWTAISRAPYLKALVMVPKGDCWDGGGLFLAPRTYWLDHGCVNSFLRDDPHLVRALDYSPPPQAGGEYFPIYYLRLIRDGWTWRRDLPAQHGAVFDKKAGPRTYLRKYCLAGCVSEQGVGVEHERHAIVHASGEVLEDHPDWQWADLDRRRIVWAAGGKLYQATPSRRGLSGPRLVHDFNDMEFEARAAPY